MQDPLAGPSALRDIIRPQFHQVNLSAEDFVKTTIGLKLDTGIVYFLRSLETNKHLTNIMNIQR